LLTGLLQKIDASAILELQLVVTGTHLLEDFGHTLDAITAAGFSVSWKVTEITHANTGKDVAVQVGQGMGGFVKAFSALTPDMLVVLGDRYEMLAASFAAFFLKIPIVHLHGGELTEGAFDDSIRHCITKISSVHCVAHPDYARRVIQLGEQPTSVHVVGGLGVDEIASVPLKSQDDVLPELGIGPTDNLFLVTYHPVTSNENDNIEQTKQLLSALAKFDDATVVLTMPNADPGHEEIDGLIRESVLAHPGSWYFFPSLGQQNYWSLMAIARAVVGNSSSGTLEAPSFHVPTVNVGPRQTGRIMAPSVVSCDAIANDIEGALRKVLSREFQQGLSKVVSPFGNPGAATKILSVIENLSVSGFPQKVFYDVGPSGREAPHAD
jgi:GDP/UDP-N,N'-diacetylbacillosamine 2-epimerase (hydrolysing)